MSQTSVAPEPQPTAGTTSWREWLPVLAGLLVLYVPTFHDLAMGQWQQDENAHGPIILAIVAWLVWRERAGLLRVPARQAPVTGFVLLTIGLLLYVLGRAFGITIFEVGSLVPVLIGVLLAMRGRKALRALWFPVFFAFFMVPLPGTFVDSLTGPLKHAISDITVRLLYPVGYPIARDGVIITVGQYQLLVADACSGLNSMFSLSALGLLFMYLVARRSMLHNLLMLLSILPIAFAANIVRVTALILITYYFGDEAGQGFLHGSAGILLLLVALGTLIALDAALAQIIKLRVAA